MARTADPDSAQRILDSAERLFYQHGVHTVGMQRIIDDCGCGKNLLYQRYPSKEDLVLAYLQRMRERWAQSLQSGLATSDTDPREQILAVIRAVGNEVGTPSYRGCAFLNARAEFPDADHPVRQVCAQHELDLRRLLGRLVRRARLTEPGRLTDELMVVVNGLRAGDPPRVANW